MSVCPNMGWSRLGGNCCVQSIMAGLKRPQQRSWKKETRFRTTPKLQWHTEKNHDRSLLTKCDFVALDIVATAIKPPAFQSFSSTSIFVFLACFYVKEFFLFMNKLTSKGHLRDEWNILNLIEMNCVDGVLRWINEIRTENALLEIWNMFVLFFL